TKKQSNIVVLVGDAGDGVNVKKKSEYSTQQIADLMYDNKVNFIAYQANMMQVEGGPYSRFNRQVRKILVQLAKKHQKVGGPAKLHPLELDNAYEIKFDNISEEDASKSPVFGGLQSVRQDGDKTTSIDPNELRKNVIKSIKEFIQKKSNEYNFLETMVNEGGDGGSLDPDDINYKYLFNYFKDNITPTPSDDEVKRLIKALQDQGEISSKGWVKMEYGNVGAPAFTHVVFMPKRMKETKLQDALRRLIASGESSLDQTRTNFQAAMIALVDGILMEVPTEDILNMTFDEVWQTILGVHFKGKLGRYKIKDIKTTVIDDKEFLRFFRTFKSQAQDFLRQEYNDDFSQWKEGQQTYYWIPLEDLPLAK
ncbi:MAG: hypothetical protein CMD23_03615, partial [Flavobacteriales bacterium]|nr:hypothetical protein [Flavobacteriales bacterium]